MLCRRSSSRPGRWTRCRDVRDASNRSPPAADVSGRQPLQAACGPAESVASIRVGSCIARVYLDSESDEVFSPSHISASMWRWRAEALTRAWRHGSAGGHRGQSGGLLRFRCNLVVSRRWFRRFRKVPRRVAVTASPGCISTIPSETPVFVVVGRRALPPRPAVAAKRGPYQRHS